MKLPSPKNSRRLSEYLLASILTLQLPLFCSFRQTNGEESTLTKALSSVMKDSNLETNQTIPPSDSPALPAPEPENEEKNTPISTVPETVDDQKIDGQGDAVSSPAYKAEDSEINPSAPSIAKDRTESCFLECCIEEHLSRIQIGGNYTYVTLKPHGNPSFHGNLGGAQALYEYRPVDRFYGAGKLTWKQGTTHGSAGKRRLLYIDLQERLGYTFSNDCEDWRVTLFSGFGYRYLGQKLLPKHASSIRFKYNEFYFPTGFLTEYDVNCWFSVGIDFTWMPQVFSTVTIVPLHGARWKLTDQLCNFYVELPLTFALTEDDTYFLIVKPFYERWRDGHTTAKLSDGSPLGLPGNTYNFYGAEVNFGFNF